MSWARPAIVLLALVCCAWFALGARQAHNLAAASGIVASQQHVTPAQARRAADALSSAATLNPDLQVDVLRGQLALEQGHSSQARSILLSVTRREPQNLNAWIQLARASANDRVTFFQAEIHIRALVRQVPAGH